MWQEWTPAAVCSPHDLFLWDGNFKLSSPSSCRHKKQSVLCVFLGTTERCFGISLFSACEWKGPFYRLQFRHTSHLVGFHAFCTAYVEKDFSQPGCINLPGSFFFGRHMVSFRCLLPLYYDFNGIRRFSYLHLPMMSSSDIDTCKCHARTFAVVLLQIPRANFFFFLFWRLPRLPLPSLVNVLNLGKDVIKGRKTGGKERDENTLTVHFCFAAVRAVVGIVTSLTEIINSLF